jgi:hypothetical protein
VKANFETQKSHFKEKEEEEEERGERREKRGERGEEREDSRVESRRFQAQGLLCIFNLYIPPPKRSRASTSAVISSPAMATATPNAAAPAPGPSVALVNVWINAVHPTCEIFPAPIT